MDRNRDQIGGKTVFFMVLGAAILSPYSLWRFPVWVHQNGGATVIIPYLVCVLVVGIPLVFLEISLGQFMQRAGTRTWGVVPLCKGLSISAMLLSLLKSSLNLIVAAWAGHYLYLTLVQGHPFPHNCLHPVDQLPSLVETKLWSTDESASLPESGATDDLLTFGDPVTFNRTQGHTVISLVPHRFDPRTLPLQAEKAASYHNGSHGNMTSHNTSNTSIPSSATRNDTCSVLHYQSSWRHDVLHATDNIAEPGAAVIPVFVGIILTMVICLVVVIRGIHWSGKILCLLTTLNFSLVIGLLVGACVMLTEKAKTGIDILWNFDSEHFTDPKIWFSCVHQVLVTHCLSINVLPSLASYQAWSNNYARDAFGVCALVTSTNLLVSFTLTAFIGRLDMISGHLNASTTTEGIFLALPYALALLPHSSIWASLFFLLIVLVVIATNAIYWETAILSLIDTSSKLRQWRVLIAMAVASLAFLLAIPMSLQSGIYIFHFLEEVINGPFLLCAIGLLQGLAMGLIYGGRQFYDNLQTMTGSRPYCWMKFCWTWLSPLVLLATISYHVYQVHQWPLDLGREPRFHSMANVMLGVTVTLLMSPLIMAGVWVFCYGRGGCEMKLKRSLHPQLEGYQIPLRWRIERTFHKFTAL